MSPLRIAAITSGSSSSSGCSARLGDRRPRRVAQLRVAGELDDLPQVVEVEQAVDLEDVLVARPRARASSCSRIARAHAGADLDAHDLAEAPAAQLVLDRLQQVVGLVGDREVGVAGDAEDVRSRRSPCPGTARRGARRSGPRAARTCARRRPGRSAAASPSAPSRARTSATSADRVAHEHAERQREVGDVGERAPEADRQRRQHREDLAPEALVERARARSASTSS